MKALIAAAFAFVGITHASAAETTRYLAFVNGGKDKAGYQYVTRDGDKYKVVFYFKDNGRGPELKEEFTLDARSILTRYRVAGTSTYGSQVDESFTLTGNRAKWKTTSDKGDQVVEDGALYSSLQGTPAGYSILLAALAQRTDGKVPLIPSGTLTGRKLLDAEVSKGSERRQIQLMALTGIGFTPTAVWATTGAKPRLFAYIFPGYMQLIEEGWESNAAGLEEKQKAAEAAMLVDLNRRTTHALPGVTLIRNARLFDSERASIAEARDVLVENGRVISVVPTGAQKRPHDRIIDAAGRVLLPGLFDMHTHLGFWEGGLHVAAGVTTARDLGNDNATLLQLMEQERAGSLLMPRVVPAGFIEGESPNASRSGFVVKNFEDVKKAIDWYSAQGWPQIKIYNSFPKDILPQTTAYAHSKGIRVSGHIPVYLRAQDAVLAGYDEIQHINQVLLNFLVTDKTDTRTLERFYLPAEKVADLDFDSAPVLDFIKLLADRKIVIDQTLATFDFIRARDGVLNEEFAAVADHVPPDVRRGFYASQMKVPEDKFPRYNKSYEKMVEFTGRLYRAGVPLVAGTDDIAGFTLHRELELLVMAGLTPLQALQVATYNGAKYAHVLHDRGTVMPGMRADLVFVDGDVTKNISDIRKIALVIKGDVAYYPAEIYENLGVKPFTPALRVD